MERSLPKSQSVGNVQGKQQQQQQQPMEVNEEFGERRIHQDETNDDDTEEDDDDNVDNEAALKKPNIPRYRGHRGLKLALRNAATAGAAGTSSTSATDTTTAATTATTDYLSAMIAAAASKTPETLVQVAVNYLEKIAMEFPKCVKAPSAPSRPLSCSCLSIFRRTKDEVPNQVTLDTARYMVYFQQLPLKEQHPPVIQWILAGRIRAQKLKEQLQQRDEFVPKKDRLLHVVYALPSFDNHYGGCGSGTSTRTADTNDIFLCQSALLRILDKKAKFWATCRKAADAGEQSVDHRRKRKFEEFEDDAKSFLGGFVELATGTGETMVSPRDGTTHEIVQLEEDVTKRQLYIQYAYEQGWIVTTDGDGKLTSKKEREANDRDGWDPADQKAIMTLTMFYDYWLKFFPYLRVAHGRSHYNNTKETMATSTTNRHNYRPCQGLSGVPYTHVIQASAIEALIAAVQANGTAAINSSTAPRTFPLATSLQEQFGNYYGMVEVRTEEENEEHGKKTTTTNTTNKEHYVIRSKSCDGVGRLGGLCYSCNQVSHSLANLSMRLALQSSSAPSSRQRQNPLDGSSSDSTATC